MATHDPHRPKPFTCPHGSCGRSFSRKHDLGRHLISIHHETPQSKIGTQSAGRKWCDNCGKGLVGSSMTCDCSPWSFACPWLPWMFCTFFSAFASWLAIQFIFSLLIASTVEVCDGLDEYTYVRDVTAPLSHNYRRATYRPVQIFWTQWWTRSFCIYCSMILFLEHTHSFIN